MAEIVPTVTADSAADYQKQLDEAAACSQRLHLDFADGQLAPRRLLNPEQAHWPEGKTIDFHVMYDDPRPHAATLISLGANLVIFHAEASVNLRDLLAELRDFNVKTGLALLQATPVEAIVPYEELLDHVLIFSGDLGHFGGQADLKLLDKVSEIKERWPNLEIGWDGGINDQNIAEITAAGVDVLNVGGFIHNSSAPQEAYAILKEKLAS